MRMHAKHSTTKNEYEQYLTQKLACKGKVYEQELILITQWQSNGKLMNMELIIFDFIWV